jgi:hypothetical protein
MDGERDARTCWRAVSEGTRGQTRDRPAARSRSMVERRGTSEFGFGRKTIRTLVSNMDDDIDYKDIEEKYVWLSSQNVLIHPLS